MTRSWSRSIPAPVKLLPHPALAAANGGPLAVTLGSESDVRQHPAANRFASPSLIFVPRSPCPPKSHATCTLANSRGCGFRQPGQTIAGHYWEIAENWIRRKLRSK